MEVKIEFIPNTISEIEFAERVKNIAKDLIETCSRNGVNELHYSHDYFKIHIKNPQITVEQDYVSILEKCEALRDENICR